MKAVKCIVAFGLDPAATSCITLPTATITRIHLMKDIAKSSLAVPIFDRGGTGCR